MTTFSTHNQTICCWFSSSSSLHQLRLQMRWLRIIKAVHLLIICKRKYLQKKKNEQASNGNETEERKTTSWTWKHFKRAGNVQCNNFHILITDIARKCGENINISGENFPQTQHSAHWKCVLVLVLVKLW